MNAGAGTLAVQIDGPSKVALVCIETDEGYDFTYTPLAPGVYMVMIKFCNVTLAGAPFKAVVTGMLNLNFLSEIFEDEDFEKCLFTSYFHFDRTLLSLRWNIFIMFLIAI